MNWYAFTPNDTLFFKGSGAMDKGLNHTAASHFPPLPETIAGALRTQIMREHHVTPEDLKMGRIHKDGIAEVLGEYGEPAPFKLTGPLLMQGDDIFVPAPFHWFAANAEEQPANKNNTSATLGISRGQQTQSALLLSPHSDYTWGAAGTGHKSLGGRWVRLQDLAAGDATLYNETHFFKRENRTGIELEENQRQAKEGHLYSFTHFRLVAGVRIVFAVNMALPLPASGLLSLGGEKRFGRLDQMPGVDLPKGRENLFLALSPVPASEENYHTLFAGGKIFYRGGWDLAKRFHKPMRGYYPAGSVFKQNINNNCIAL